MPMICNAFKAEDYLFSSAIDYAGGKGLLNVKVV